MKLKIHTERIDLADELEEDFHEEAKGIVEEAANVLLEHTKANLSRYTSGRAAENAPPVLRTGALLRSMKLIKAKVKGRIVTSGIISRDPGANRVEFGDTDSRGIRTLPHPFVRPAYASARPVIDALLADKFGGKVEP